LFGPSRTAKLKAVGTIRRQKPKEHHHMTQSIPRAFQFVPGLAFILLQACGGGASQLDANDLGAANEELGAGGTDATPDCALPAICQLCDDGTCATPDVKVVNGECGPVTYTCESAPSDNGNSSSAPANSPGNAGQTTPSQPPSGVDCPVPLLCQLCDDGTCATTNVEIVNGECGPVTYSCSSAAAGSTAQGPSTSPPSEPNCPVIAICQLCDDGTCATPEVEYKDGECGAVHFVCPESTEGSTGSAASTSGAQTQE
jgi:hypothetical protein